MKKLLLVLIALAAVGHSAYSQQNDLDDSKRYIKIIIDSEVTQQQQQEINQAMNQLPGVETSRMDNTTELFLSIYVPGDQLSEQTFLNWFTNHGYVIKCYYDAVYTQAGMINLSKTSCP
ncbi:MAG: hypothetical protein ACO1N0_16730 [Fluviicola sp.]